MSTRRRATNDMTIDVPLVQRLLDGKGWDWKDLAEAMHVSKSSMSRVTRYESRPSAAFIFGIMRVFPQYRDVLFVPTPTLPKIVSDAQDDLSRSG